MQNIKETQKVYSIYSLVFVLDAIKISYDHYAQHISSLDEDYTIHIFKFNYI